MKNTKTNIKINHDYFSLSSRLDNFKYFVGQGHVFAHIIDRLRWFYYPKYSLTPHFPTHLEIEASSACQMRCPMCKTTVMAAEGIKFQGVMDLELYKKIIDQTVGKALYSIKLSWRGEPLLNPRILEMITYAKQKRIKDVAFLSNGERLTPEISQGLVHSGLDWISISFDGMGEVYNSIRKPAIFEETYAKIKYLRQYRDQMNKRKPLIRVQSVHSAIKGKEEEFLKMWTDVADRVNFIADQKRSIRKRDYRHDPSYICPSPWQRMCIGWDGKVAQCYGDYMMDAVLGDANTTPLKEIWKGSAFNDLRSAMKDGCRLSTKPCRTCSDGGVTEEEEVIVGKRKIKAVHYVHQGVDVKEFSSGMRGNGKP